MTQLSFEQMVASMDTDPRAIPAAAAEEVDAEGNGRMTDPAQILRFILAGNSRFTLRSTKTGQRFTYRIRASEDGRVHFVSLLTGQDNESSYSYFGYIRHRGVYFHGGAKAKVGAEAPSAKGFAWFYRHVVSAHRRMRSRIDPLTGNNAMKLITERKLTNQRSFICHCEQCRSAVGPITRKSIGGKWWRAQYGEDTKVFHTRVRALHKSQASQ